MQKDIINYFIDRALYLMGKSNVTFDENAEFFCETCKKKISKKQVTLAANRKRIPKYCSKLCWQQREREHNYDTDFLDKKTDFAGYFIGLFITDGHKSKQDGTVSIELTDKQIIDDVVKYTHYKNTVSYSDRKKTEFVFDGKVHISVVKPTYRIRYSGPIRKAMDAMGFPNGRKTGKEFIPDWITDDIFYACLRGIIDGDGSFDIEKEHKYLRCAIYNSSLHLLNQIHERLKRLGIVSGGAIKKKPTVHKLYFGHADSVSIGDFVYKNITVTLQRKYENYVLGKKTELKLESQKDKVCSVPGCGFPSRSKGLCKVCYDRDYQKNLTPKQKERKRETDKKWKDENKEKINTRRRELYAENPEKHKEQVKKWKEENPEKVKIYKKEYTEEHREEINKWKQQYRKENPEKHKEWDRNKYQRNKEYISAREKEKYQRNREERLQKAKEYREANRELIRQRDRENYQKNKEKRKKARMERYYKEKASKSA